MIFTKVKFILICSGGKDSCYNMMFCKAMGHQIVALANLYPTTEGKGIEQHS